MTWRIIPPQIQYRCDGCGSLVNETARWKDGVAGVAEEMQRRVREGVRLSCAACRLNSAHEDKEA